MSRRASWLPSPSVASGSSPSDKTGAARAHADPPKEGAFVAPPPPSQPQIEDALPGKPPDVPDAPRTRSTSQPGSSLPAAVGDPAGGGRSDPPPSGSLPEEAAPAAPVVLNPIAHAPTFETCKPCRPQGAARKIHRDAVGTPVGKGTSSDGEPCGDCGMGHPHGQPCVWAGLEANGWQTNGSQNGRKRWMGPHAIRRKRSTQKKTAHRRATTVEVDRNTAEFLSTSVLPGTRRVMKAAVARVPDPAPHAFTQKLDPQTYRTWLMVAKGRLGNLDERQIAEVCGIDRQRVSELVSSSAFIYFESEFRAVMGTDVGMDKVRERLAAMTDKALDTLEFYLEADRRNPAYWAANLKAYAEWRASMGLEPKEKRGATMGVAVLTPKDGKALMVACVKEGA